MESNFKVNMNEYLPLRDVDVQYFETGDLARRVKTGRKTDGDPACK